MALSKQMEMFEDGGLKDEGGMIDEVSGNDVPSGSTREEVRDDIPAQLSEGEFVFPADVVRFIGLEKLMTIRQEAKQGLKQMEAMGQMGNSDEATMRDDMPFDINDLDMEDEVEYNRGGVVEAANGTYVAPTVPTGIQPLGTNPMGNPVGVTQQVADGVSGSTQGTPYTPNVGNMYTPTAQAYAPVSYNEFLGPSAGGAPTTENVRYFNEATGQTRMIPHLVNADGTRGATLYPVPEGFVIQEEAPKEEAKETRTATARVAPVESGDSGSDDDGMVGDLGGARTTIGGVDYAIQYNFDGTVGLQSIGNYKATGNRNFQIATPEIASAIKTQTLGQLSQLGKVAGLKGLALAELAKKTTGIDIIPDKVEDLIKDGEAATRTLKKINPAEVSIFDPSQFLEKTQTKEYLDEKLGKRTGKDLYSRPARDIYGDRVEKYVTGKGAEGLTEKDMRSIQSGLQSGTGQLDTSGIDLSNINTGYVGSSGDDNFNTQSSGEGNNPGASMESSAATSGLGDLNTGGLVGKKKPKPKKMKRGGLASR